MMPLGPIVSLGSNLTVLLAALAFGALLFWAYHHGRRR